MKKDVICQEETTELAINKALIELNANSEQVDVSILQNHNVGILGIGKKPAIVKVTLKELIIKEREDRINEQKNKVEFKIKENIKSYVYQLINFPYFMAVAFIYIKTIFEKNNLIIELADIADDIEEYEKFFSDYPNLNDESFDYKNKLEELLKKTFSKYLINNRYSNVIDFNSTMSGWTDLLIKDYNMPYVLMKLVIIGNFDVYLNDDEMSVDNEDVVNEFQKNLKQLANYMITIFAFCRMNTVINYTEKLKANDELYTIIKNDTINGIKIDEYEDTYKIYNEFYSNVFGEKLNSEQYTVVVNTAIITDNVLNNMDTINTTLQLVNIDLKSLVLEMNDKKAVGESPYNYVLETLLKGGRFNSLFSSEEWENLTEALINGINFELLDISSLSQWIYELFESYMVHDKMMLYGKKHSLLNCDKTKIDAVKRIKNALDEAVTGEDFELILKMLYETMGYIVSTTKATGDQGADLILEKQGKKSVVQAKYYSSPVGNAAVQEVVGALKFYNADKGIVITNNSFTPAAIALAKANDIQLINGDMLNACINMIV